MKRLSARIHGVIDYGTVLILLISPGLFGMHTAASIFTYVLALVHLALTIFTDFDFGIVKVVPLRIHGLIELIVAFALIGIAFTFNASADQVAFYFYLIFAVVLFVVWIASDYKASFHHSKES